MRIFFLMSLSLWSFLWSMGGSQGEERVDISTRSGWVRLFESLAYDSLRSSTEENVLNEIKVENAFWAPLRCFVFYVPKKLLEPEDVSDHAHIQCAHCANKFDVDDRVEIIRCGNSLHFRHQECPGVS